MKPALLMEFIPHVSLIKLLELWAKTEDPQTIKTVDQLLKRSAELLGNLHNFSLNHRSPIDPKFKKIEIEKLNNGFSSETLNQLLQKGWITKPEVMQLSQTFHQLSLKFQNSNSIPGTIIHGDAHPGNILYNPETDSARFIDVRTLAKSYVQIGDITSGVSDPIADVGKYLAALILSSRLAGLTLEQTKEISSLFVKAYKQVTQFDSEMVDTSLDFYFLRFASSILNKYQDPNNFFDETLQRLTIEWLKTNFLYENVAPHSKGS